MMPRHTNFESCYAHFGQLGSQGKMKRTILFVLSAIRTLCQFIVLPLKSGGKLYTYSCNLSPFLQ
jgi:hypothetical protein